jgi:redox-sensitive bicupin YhaK (pirin superfamily)
MTKPRKIKRVSSSRPTLEGAGVHLKRAFGFGDEHLFDPFLLMDDFRGDNPSDYIKGFPWHPHRGIETISAGDVQWMTAGSGIIHQEMPNGDDQGRMYGFQLWANLPASRKMMDPRYQEVKSAQIPEVTLEGGVRIRIICGNEGEVTGPVHDIVIDPQYLDISIPAGREYRHTTKPDHTVFVYIFEGEGTFPDASAEKYGNDSLVLFDFGDEVRMLAGSTGMRLLLISGCPLGEPISWYGPIVMNTDEELELAFKEYREGTFIKKKG